MGIEVAMLLIACTLIGLFMVWVLHRDGRVRERERCISIILESSLERPAKRALLDQISGSAVDRYEKDIRLRRER